MVNRNPKQVGTDIWDCVPQVGPCPNSCNQCYYNRPGAYYTDISKPLIPDPAEVGDGVVRVNCGHDSNLDWPLVVETSRKYKNYFFNTSIASFNFPGPVVYTANSDEEAHPNRQAHPPEGQAPANLMFVRLRVSASNLKHVLDLAIDWTLAEVPVVLTFMRYYDEDALNYVLTYQHSQLGEEELYTKKTHIKNEYWCPTRYMMLKSMFIVGMGTNRLMSACGTLDSSLCKDCRNCESYYWITKQRLDALEAIKDGLRD